MPESNVADEFSNHYAFADLVATVEFADGSQVAMQTDSRMVFAISDECGSFANSGSSKRLTIASTCRSSSVTVSAQLTIGSASVETTHSFTSSGSHRSSCGCSTRTAPRPSPRPRSSTATRAPTRRPSSTRSR